MDTKTPAERPIAIVTGGSRGIGRAIVERLASAGFEVHFTYLSNATAAQAVVQELAEKGLRAVAAAVDARDATASAEMVERTITAHGRLDLLVNNAGVTADRLLVMMGANEWTNVLETSLNSLFGTSRIAAKQMMRQRAGRMVNVTSVSGLIGIPGQANYSAAKAAIIGFTRSLAKELAPLGIPANAVAPGFVDTDMIGAMSQAQRDQALARVPMRRFAKADEIASLVAYLAVDAPTYLTGQTLTIDGGLSS